MSGGHFDYNQHKIFEIKENIDELIKENDYSEETMEIFRQTADLLSICYVLVKRIDWLVSGDDGEDTFHKRIGEEFLKMGIVYDKRLEE